MCMKTTPLKEVKQATKLGRFRQIYGWYKPLIEVNYTTLLGQFRQL